MRFWLLVFTLALIVGPFCAASSASASGTSKYCSSQADNIVIYIDRTTNYDDTDKRELLDGISKIYSTLNGGERLSIRTIADTFASSTNLLDECVPVCVSKGFLADLFSSDCTEGVAINDRNHLRGEVVAQVQNLLNSYSDLPYSEIVRTISFSSSSEIRAGQHNRFFVFTDLIENSVYLPGKDFFNIRNDNLLAKLATDGLIPKLDGVDVRVFGVGRSGKPGRPALQQALLEKLMDFWQRYFAAAHAVVTIQQSLGGSN